MRVLTHSVSLLSFQTCDSTPSADSESYLLSIRSVSDPQFLEYGICYLFDKSCRYGYFSEIWIFISDLMFIHVILLSGMSKPELEFQFTGFKPFSKKKKEKKIIVQCFKNMFYFSNIFKFVSHSLDMLKVGGTVSVFYSWTPTAALFATSP